MFKCRDKKYKFSDAFCLQELVSAFMSRDNYQDGVPDEEDGRVVAHQIPVTIFCVEFHCETAWITGSVCRTTLSTYNTWDIY